MKRGNVRIPLIGEMSDFDDTMILDKSELEQTKDQQQVGYEGHDRSREYFADWLLASAHCLMFYLGCISLFGTGNVGEKHENPTNCTFAYAKDRLLCVEVQHTQIEAAEHGECVQVYRQLCGMSPKDIHFHIPIK